MPSISPRPNNPPSYSESPQISSKSGIDSPAPLQEKVPSQRNISPVTTTPWSLKDQIHAIQDIVSAFFHPMKHPLLKQYESELSHIKSENKKDKFAELEDLMVKIVEMEDDLHKIVHPTPDLKLQIAECMKLKTECRTTIRHLMESTAKALAKAHDGRADIESMFRGEQINIEPTLVSNGLHGIDQHTLFLPGQMVADMDRMSISFNGNTLHFDPQNNEPAKFQIGSQLIDKIGLEKLNKLGTILHQSMATKFLIELVVGNKSARLQGFGVCSAANISSDLVIKHLGLVPTEEILAKYTEMLSPQLHIEEKAAHFIVTFSMLSKFETSYTNPQENLAFNQVFCKVKVTATISKKELEKPADQMKVKSVLAAVSKFVEGYENIEKLNKPSLRERISLILNRLSLKNISQLFHNFFNSNN